MLYDPAAEPTHCNKRHNMSGLGAEKKTYWRYNRVDHLLKQALHGGMREANTMYAK
jgi:hypothetical protein